MQVATIATPVIAASLTGSLMEAPPMKMPVAAQRNTAQ